MKSTNPWDILSDYFDTSKSAEEIPSGAADNMFIAWPVLLQFIATYCPDSKNKTVLDYGCGGGSFANKLSQLGFSVTGIDSAEHMISIAKKAYGKEITFYVGDTRLLLNLKPFDVITSIMTLQFIKDIEETIATLSQALVPHGLLIFAVHNPDFVKEGIQKEEYPEFDSADNPTRVLLRFENAVKVPMYIRTAGTYNKLALQYKLKPLLEEYPSFPKGFTMKYPDYASYKQSEYLILGYKKE